MLDVGKEEKVKEGNRNPVVLPNAFAVITHINISWPFLKRIMVQRRSHPTPKVVAPPLPTQVPGVRKSDA